MNDVLELRISKIRRESEDAFSYFLETTDGTLVTYHAGQFLTLIFRYKDRDARRSYSLISSPSSDKELAITIKRLENGEFSRYLIENLKAGDIIKSLPPAGRFTLQASSNNKKTYFMLAAGSGITPIFSLLKTLLHDEPGSRAVLISSSPSERKTIFYNQLKKLQSDFPDRLRCIFLFSEQGERLGNDLLEKIVTENLPDSKTDTAFYFCGPASYMRMITLTLKYMGFKDEQLHKENFIPENIVQESLIPRNNKARQVRINYKGKNFSVTVLPHQTILDAALSQKINLPYSCKTGLCSTCAAICKNGKVEMTNNQVLTEKDLREGWVLTCTGFPMDDEIELEVTS